MDDIRIIMLKNLGISSLLVILCFSCIYMAITGCTAWLRQTFGGGSRGNAAPETIYRPRRSDNVRTRSSGNARRRRPDDGFEYDDNDDDDNEDDDNDVYE